MIDLLTAIGRPFAEFLGLAGRLALFAGKSLSHCVRPPFYLHNLSRQFWSIGYNSLPVVGLTAIFIGGVLALQAYTGFSRFSGAAYIPNLVVVAVTRELGPVMAGLMVAGRVGAAIAAEIGTMRVTEQISALETLATDPMKYLVVPRILAGILMMPLLVLVADIIGIMGGFVVSTLILDFNETEYLSDTFKYMTLWDVLSGLIKASVFGFIVTLMGCFTGYRSQGGAQGVGGAATSAVVTASILILGADYFLTQLFFAR